MDFLRTWMLGIVITSFAVGMAQQIVPKGREQSAVRLVGGLLMALALLRPLGGIALDEYAVSVGRFGESLKSQTEVYMEKQQKEFCAIIAEKMETYIWDKATELGLDCKISVDVVVQESGVPLPDTVTIYRPYVPALGEWLEEVVGIPADKQIWQEGSTWTWEKNESS